MGAKVVISKRAAIARINRKLKKTSELLKACKRDSRSWSVLGDFYTVDLNRKTVSGSKLSLGNLAKELNVIEAWETIEN